MFLKYNLLCFLISRLILFLAKGCLSLDLTVLFGINLFMALSNSDVMLSVTDLPGLKCQNLILDFCQTLKYVV